ncbi:MAG: hypothetical protein IMW89_06315, partial [Ktedonobacteraceae bacterium]|nr:hypothetical protein [Ktedonobacteraceae bacterium]
AVRGYAAGIVAGIGGNQTGSQESQHPEKRRRTNGAKKHSNPYRA